MAKTFDDKKIIYTMDRVSRAYGTKVVLKDISISYYYGAKIGVIGENGAGKSSLFKIFAGIDHDYTGETKLLDGYSMGYLEQEPYLEPGKTVLEIVKEGVKPITDLLEEFDKVNEAFGDPDADFDKLCARQADLQEKLDAADAWNLDANLELAMDALRCPPADQIVDVLSGGERRRVALCRLLLQKPDILLLDEPTAQLDPISATAFLEAVSRLHRETALTVVICEHRAEELFPISDRVVILDNGKIIHDDAPRQVAAAIGVDSPCFRFLPTPTRIAKATGDHDTPLTIREGQCFIGKFPDSIKKIPEEPRPQNTEIALELKSIFFRYDRQSPDILSDLSLTVNRGEVFALLGANGAGKSTLAAVAAGLRKPYSGSVKLFGKRLKDYKNGSLYRNCLSLLPQDVESMFIRETVGEEFKGCETIVKNLPYELSPLSDRHPYDLSGGERQLVALSKALSTEPRFLIMDEPSKGLDPNVKSLLCDIIRDLKRQNVTVLLITHDVEFAASCADRCALFSHGRIVACDPVADFLFDNRFYTTAASRITRDRFDDAYTVERAVRLIELSGGVR